jgi:hypothetical protein
MGYEINHCHISSLMTDSIIKNRKEIKQSKDIKRDREERNKLSEHCKPFSGEDSEILSAVKRLVGIKKLNTKLMVDCGNCLSSLAGIPLPGRHQKRQHRFIVGWMNEKAELLLPHLGNVICKDNRGNYSGTEEMIDHFKTWEQENPDDPSLIEAERYLIEGE